MMYLSMVFLLLAAFVHVFIFYLESIIWGTPKANKVFQVKEEKAQSQKLFAYNQGFYNLFLAVQIFVGVILLREGDYPIMAKTLCASGALSMVGAAIVLLTSAPHLIRAVIIQGLAPLLGIIFLFLS